MILQDTEINSIENIRDVYDSALKYNFRCNKAPLVMREQDIDRMMVNHIRHKYSSYENNLHKIDRMKMPNRTYYNRYKNKILNDISDKYPFLRQECNRQKHKVNMVRKVKPRGE